VGTGASDDPAAQPGQSPNDKTLERWQERLLPFMLAVILLLALFFFVASLVQLYTLQQHILETAPLTAFDLPDLPAQLAAQSIHDPETTLAAGRFQTLALLDLYALQRRHHRASVLLMAREWVRYLGFVTGMILAFVGAVFILGKLREEETEASAEGPAGKLGLRTTSPGIFLVTAGVVLMIVTISTHHEIYVTDSPVFTQVDALMRSGRAEVTDKEMIETPQATPTAPALRPPVN
jgi:hypothetical protein